MRLNANAVLSSGLLAGTIIGAGIFSLPYVVSKVGLVLGFFYLLFFTFVYFCIHSMYAAICLRHEGSHRFVYFAEHYFSPRARIWADFIIVGEMIFTLAIYLVLAPSFMELIVGWSGLPLGIVFWAVSSIFIFVELSILGVAEMFGIAGILGIIFLILGAGEGSVSSPLFVSPSHWIVLLLPFGPLLFSFSGRPAIPKMVEEYRIAKKEGRGFKLKNAIMLGTIAPLLTYLVFVFAVLRINPNVTTDALSGFSGLPQTLLVGLGIVGFLALWTSYFMIGLNVKDLLRSDLKVRPSWSSLLVLFVPLLFYVSGIGTFLELVAFTGSVFLAFEGMFIVRMWQKAFPSHRLRALSFSLYFVFAAALFYEVARVVL